MRAPVLGNLSVQTIKLCSMSCGQQSESCKVLNASPASQCPQSYHQGIWQHQMKEGADTTGLSKAHHSLFCVSVGLFLLVKIGVSLCPQWQFSGMWGPGPKTSAGHLFYTIFIYFLDAGPLQSILSEGPMTVAPWTP